jgi:hypothetical protein
VLGQGIEDSELMKGGASDRHYLLNDQ